ncbi:hypothetical protein C789_1483 [Microcystis aeruginosa FACHB-905 = DIANCHI905]|uniref:Uncharacterized protein n=1 Tax=Microcystis aeruginosa PCC 7806SL TaxID=1903187 RepID=A0AB33BWY3_MICA7|nr:hypothetical protein BH695_2586 [Microcystis aeruginosa PCC 7806SL]ELS48722.1 hypothetical protein C789_1483 [Microcystis aeruginosa FACHB-905 = DIANCHI905]
MRFDNVAFEQTQFALPDEQAICAQYLRHNRVRYFALI